MIDDNELVKVQNLTDYRVIYTAYTGQRRSFEGNAFLRVPAIEVRQLNYTTGGNVLLRNYLSVRNRELAEEIGIEEFDQEYSWDDEDIERVLISGSEDELEDALDFAPKGVIEAIVDKAVKISLPDNNKRKLIFEHTGKNINNMIDIAEKAVEGNRNDDKAPARQRRVKKKPVEEEAEEPKPRRRTAAKKKTAEAVDKDEVAVDESTEEK